MIKYVLFDHIHITYYLTLFLSLIAISKKITNSPNPITHLMVSSLKKIRENNQTTKFNNFINQFFFHIQLHAHLQLKFIIANQVEKISRGVPWPMNNLPSCKNYIFIYFGMSLKRMIQMYFSFSFSSKSTLITNINCICNSKTTLQLFMRLQVIFIKSHE